MRGLSKIDGGIAPCHIGIDLLGSDTPPNQLLEAILSFSGELDPVVNLTLFGTSELFSNATSPCTQILFHPVEEIIGMDEAPLTAIRRKKNSSLCIGIQMIKQKHLHAFISAGNTGALMACAKIELPELPSIERPAFLTLLPTKHSQIAVLDVGANTSYKANHLVQFAAMGIAYQKGRGIEMPTVGLLNIGSEAKKGTPELQLAYNQLLHLSHKKNTSFLFSGNIEGRDVFHSKIDVLVTDGFTGNVFLKTAEGIAAVILEELQILNANDSLHAPLSALRQRLCYSEHPGAILCGIDGIVLKCHGSSNPMSLIRSITTAKRLVHHSFLTQIKEELEKII